MMLAMLLLVPLAAAGPLSGPAMGQAILVIVALGYFLAGVHMARPFMWVAPLVAAGYGLTFLLDQWAALHRHGSTLPTPIGVDRFQRDTEPCAGRRCMDDDSHTRSLHMRRIFRILTVTAVLVMATGATALAGNITVGARTLLGMGVTSYLGLAIGADVRAGNGAILNVDVPDDRRIAAGSSWDGDGR